jgi:hypothetical protein
LLVAPGPTDAAHQAARTESQFRFCWRKFRSAAIPSALEQAQLFWDVH